MNPAKKAVEVPILNCGAYANIEHDMHMWRWRSSVIPPDLTFETTAYRYCPGVLRREVDVIRVVGPSGGVV